MESMLMWLVCADGYTFRNRGAGLELNPGRYVGVADREADDFDFKERLEELNEELRR